MADVLFHPDAQAEYEAAIGWYQARSAGAAARFEAEVERVLELIDANPQTFPKYDDEHRFAVLQRFPYSLVFQFQLNCIYVIAVAHGSRSPDYWQSRE